MTSFSLLFAGVCIGVFLKILYDDFAYFVKHKHDASNVPTLELLDADDQHTAELLAELRDILDGKKHD